MPTLVIGAFLLWWVILWSGALTYSAEGLWAGHRNIWADWALHIGDTASFAYGDNFLPQHPRLSGHSYAYHYLASLTAAMIVKLGMDPTAALPLHSYLFSVLLALALYAFARRLTGDRVAAVLALLLFLLGGGLDWLMTVEKITWRNIYFTVIMPQRAFLYGLPLGMLSLTLLLTAVQRRDRRVFLVAGVVAGLLPLAHLGTLLAMALITPFLVLLFPAGKWVFFFGAWVVITVPQLYVQLGSERGALGALRMQVGWMAPPDSWPGFWLTSLGCFLPLLGLALAQRNLLPAPAQRFLWAFMPVFAIGNLVVFQPWDWDNTKVFLYWFLAVCILVAALIAKTWRRSSLPIRWGRLAGIGTFMVQWLLAGVTLSLILSGLMVNLKQLLEQDQHLFLTLEEVQLAEAVRAETPRHTIFVVGLQHNHPVPMLTGRQVVVGYSGWLSTQGYDYEERERDLYAIYALAPNAPQLLAKYRVDYVVIGPREREELAANLAAYLAHYPTIIRTANYQVFAVGQGPP